MVGAFIPGEVAERGGDAVQLALIMLAPLLALLLIAYPAHRLVQTHGALHVMRRGLVLGAAARGRRGHKEDPATERTEGGVADHSGLLALGRSRHRSFGTTERHGLDGVEDVGHA